MVGNESFLLKWPKIILSPSQCPSQWKIILKVLGILDELGVLHEDLALSGIFTAESKNEAHVCTCEVLIC